MLLLSRFTWKNNFCQHHLVSLSFILSDRLFIFFYRDLILVSYSAYERVAFTAINAVAESLGYITSLLRLFCHLKVPPPVCFICRAATTASGKICRAELRILSLVWAGLKCSQSENIGKSYYHTEKLDNGIKIIKYGVALCALCSLCTTSVDTGCLKLSPYISTALVDRYCRNFEKP